MEREDFGRRKGIDEVKDDSPSASIVGIGIPALVIALAAGMYFLWPASDGLNQAQYTPPAASGQQSSPAPTKTTPEEMKVTPEQEKKPPPAADTDKPREPRSDSHNSN